MLYKTGDVEAIKQFQFGVEDSCECFGKKRKDAEFSEVEAEVEALEAAKISTDLFSTRY